MRLRGHVLSRSRRSGWATVVAAVLFLASVGAAYAHVEVAALAIAASLLGLIIAAPLHLSWTKATATPATVETDGRAVFADGRPLRRHVTAARIIMQSMAPVVEIRRWLDPYPSRLRFATLEEAQAFVRALGLDAREGASRFRAPVLRGMLRTFVLASCGLGAYVSLGSMPWLFPAFAALGIALGRWRQTITIGKDGILVEGPGGRFLPYTDIIAMERERRETWTQQPMVSRGFTVFLASGGRVFLSTISERLREGMFRDDFLYDAAVAAHKAVVRGPAVVAALLARGTRDAHQWLRELRAAGDARYRVAAVREEDLLAVLTDPSADGTARVGAAVCLATSDADTRAKVRIAADDIAAPELRAAVDAAVAGDDDQLVGKLDALTESRR